MRCTTQPAPHPLLWAALGFAVGVSVGARAWRPASWWVLAVLAFALAILWFTRRRPWIARLLAITAWVLLGALTIQILPPLELDARILEVADGRQVTIVGHVVREGYLRSPERQFVRQQIDLETESIEDEDAPLPIRAGVRLTIFEKPAANDAATSDPTPDAIELRPNFEYGSRLRLRATLHPPRNYRNPGAFDYEGYLRDRGIIVLGSAQASNVELLPGFSGSRIERWRTQIHASIVAKIHQLWLPPQAALLDAMVMGEDAFLENATRTEFQRSGTYHILVVSGMNLSILAFVIFWTLRLFHVDPALASIVTVLVSFAYAFVTGVGAPVWRAVLMLTIYLGARFLYRERSMLNALGAAALGLLTVDPGALFSASFQLTFLSVLIIAAIGVPLLERSTQPYARALRLLPFNSYDLHVEPRAAQFRLDLRMISGRLARFVGGKFGLAIPRTLARVVLGGCELLFISALMQAGLALPMACYFHRATTLSMPANLLVVPLTEVLMPAAAAAVALGYVSTTLALPAVWVSRVSLDLITGTVHWLGGVRLADLRVAAPSLVLIVSALAALALAMIVVRRSRACVLAALAAVAVTAMWIAVVPSKPQLHSQLLEITAIDVGQGDSTLLVTPTGRTLLVDAGGMPLWMHSTFDVGEQVVSPYLWSRGIERLDVVVITHPHADHLGGMPSVIANFHPRELWSSTDRDTGELAPILAQAREAGMEITVRRGGEEFDYGGAHFRVLAPRQDQNSGALKPNEDSLAFTVTLAATSALLEGDAERPTERRIVQQHPEAALLKVAHHGSAGATSSELLATVQPQYAVISSGVRNVYGHPRREVLQRLQEAKVRTYRTDTMGAVTFYLDGRAVTPELALNH